MYRPILSIVLLCVIAHASAAATQFSETLSADLIGKWHWPLPRGTCAETHEYRSDGTRFVVSGDERSDSVYTVEAIPGSRFRKMTITTTKDYRGKDCGGEDEDDTGRTSSVFFLISPDNNQVLFCYEPALRDCYGPFQRIRP